jgi:hypothetical protein
MVVVLVMMTSVYWWQRHQRSGRRATVGVADTGKGPTTVLETSTAFSMQKVAHRRPHLRNSAELVLRVELSQEIQDIIGCIEPYGAGQEVVPASRQGGAGNVPAQARQVLVPFFIDGFGDQHDPGLVFTGRLWLVPLLGARAGYGALGVSQGLLDHLVVDAGRVLVACAINACAIHAGRVPDDRDSKLPNWTGGA